MQFDYSALESVYIGRSVEQALPDHAARLDANRLFLVASASLARATDNLASLRRALGDRFAGMATDIRAHTPREDVLQVLGQVRAAGADLLVSLGGGSVIDACKVIRLALAHDLSTAEQLLEFAQRADGSRGRRHGAAMNLMGVQQIRQVAVPTTLSGAEFSNNAGVLDTSNNAKEGYRAPGLCPQAIIYDAALTRLTPEWLFLSTAIRSLDHAIEGFCASDSSPFHDAHFLQAMNLFAASLPITQAEPDNFQSRSLNQHAVWLACCDLGNVPHGASHGIGYILGSLHGIPHGYTSCVMLPAVLKWNQDYLPQRLQQVAAALGEPQQFAHEAVRQLIEKLQLPASLQSLEIRKDQLDEIAERAIQHPVVKKNPKPLTTSGQVREILELAWS